MSRFPLDPIFRKRQEILGAQSRLAVHDQMKYLNELVYDNYDHEKFRETLREDLKKLQKELKELTS